MASVDRALVASPKLRASILAHRRRQHFIFPRAAVPSDFHDFTSGALRPGLGEGGRYSVKTIFEVVSDISGFPLIAIRSQRRKRDLSWARQVAYWLCRQHTELSLPAIAKHFGGRDHTTIMSGCRVVERAIASESIDITDELHVMARRLLALGWANRARLARKAA